MNCVDTIEQEAYRNEETPTDKQNVNLPQGKTARNSMADSWAFGGREAPFLTGGWDWGYRLMVANLPSLCQALQNNGDNNNTPWNSVRDWACLGLQLSCAIYLNDPACSPNYHSKYPLCPGWRAWICCFGISPNRLPGTPTWNKATKPLRNLPHSSSATSYDLQHRSPIYFQRTQFSCAVFLCKWLLRHVLHYYSDIPFPENNICDNLYLE